MAPSLAGWHDVGVRSSLTADRVRGDIDVLARAGLDVASFLEEVDASLRRAIPYEAACFGLHDPSTELLTNTYKFGTLYGNDDHDDDWGAVEYGDVETTTFSEMARRDVTSLGMHEVTGGCAERSPRMSELIVPCYGYTDELRLAAKSGNHLWGGAALFRSGGDAPFSPQEVAFVGTLSTMLAVGLRAGVLTRLASTSCESVDPYAGPAVMIVGPDGRPSQVSMGAEHRLAQLAAGTHTAGPTGVIASLVARARRFASGDVDLLPRARVRLSTGHWYVLHAAPLAGRDGSTGDVVITIEEARPPEIVPLVVAAFDLTPRERDVIQLVLQGVETKEIAAALHLSTYTVQDHLKSIFEKADVRSRRQLMARVFFDQYTPRMGGELAPSGWFASAD